MAKEKISEKPKKGEEMFKKGELDLEYLIEEEEEEEKNRKEINEMTEDSEEEEENGNEVSFVLNGIRETEIIIKINEKNSRNKKRNKKFA